MKDYIETMAVVFAIYPGIVLWSYLIGLYLKKRKQRRAEYLQNMMRGLLSRG